MTGDRDIRMIEKAAHRVERRASGKASHLDVLKTMVSEPRLPHFLALAFQNVSVRLELLVRPFLHDVLGDVASVEPTILVQPLAILHDDLGAGRALDCESRSASHVLAEIEHKHARLRLGEFHRLERSSTRIGGIICATSLPFGASTIRAGCQSVSLKPGVSQPGFSKRASYVSPP